MKAWVPHDQATELLGQLPESVRVEIWSGGEMPSSYDEVEFVVPPFLGSGEVTGLLNPLPRLRVVQTLTAGVDSLLGLREDIVLCDARGVHDPSTAEWVVAAMLAAVRDLPSFALAQAAGRWAFHGTDTLVGKRVLIVGYGSIGAAVEARLAGFDVAIERVARRARPDEPEVHGVDALPRLLPEADVVVLIVPLTEQTRNLVDAEFLGRMRDGALLVNAARGPVVDTDALAAELQSGRLRAAVDVTEPEPLPEGHPLWSAAGLLLTPHVAGSTTTLLPRAYRLVADQLRRHVAGEPLVNVVDRAAGY